MVDFFFLLLRLHSCTRDFCTVRPMWRFGMNGRECDNILCIHIKPWSKEAKTEMEWRKREMESREMKNRNIISTIDFCSVLHLLSLSRWGLLSTFYRVCLCCWSLSCTTYVIPFSSSFSANICWLCVSLLSLLATTLVVWSVSCTVFISKCEYVRVFVCVFFAIKNVA